MNLPRWLNITLLKNTSWMLLSEGMSRATRLVTIIVLAACLSSADYGIAMLALAYHEILRVLMRAGSGPKIIQCADEELDLIARNGASLQWIICLSLGLIQWVTAAWIAHFYQNQNLALLLQIMALSYLFYPMVSLRVFMLQRSNQIRYFGLASGACIMVDNLSCALLVYCGVGILSVAYSKIIAAIAWVLCFYFAPVQRFGISFNPRVIINLGKFSGRILGTETMRVMRTQLDMVIAGRLLSPEMLGIYSFAKSAGVGLSQSLSAAYINVLYPHICKQERLNPNGCKQSPIFLMSGAVASIFLLQALIAPYYIDWLFADHWQSSAAIVSLLCLSAIPSLLIDTECNFLRAQTKITHEFLMSAYCVLVTVLGLLLINPQTPLAFAETLALSSLFWLTAFSHRLFQSQTLMLTRTHP